MTIFFASFIGLSALLLILLPRKYAIIPIIATVCYTPSTLSVDIASINFTVLRIMIAVGYMRIIIKKEFLSIRKNKLDYVVIISSLWTIFTSFFHENVVQSVIFRCGFVFNFCGVYFLFRIFISTIEEIIIFLKFSVIILVPVAIVMTIEKVTEINIFHMLAGIDQGPAIRAGRIRAQAAFGHAILAGTVGAVNIANSIGLYQINRKISVVGIISSVVIISASASSGPILSAIAAIAFFMLYRYRQRIKLKNIIIFLIIGYIFLDLLMQAPAYYLIARSDIVGGSTGWHRARLIEAAIDHFSEWWLAGTDYTRHWMPYGVYFSDDHSDITNHYIRLGVIGGFPIVVLTIYSILICFEWLLKGINLCSKIENTSSYQTILWSLGCSLFVLSFTGISISYHDQSLIFLYGLIGIIGSLNFIEQIDG
jgi:hypothetical protein